MNEQRFYKALDKGGVGPYSGVQWSLPKNGRPGAWMLLVDEVVECISGYHFCCRKDLVCWLQEEIYEIEIRGRIYRYSDKCAARQARLVCKLEEWTQQNMGLFAADCAEQVLPIYEREYPDDDRPRGAIKAIRRYILGEIAKDELAAACAAACAACAAANSASAASAASAAANAAWAAAANAAWAAATCAACAAANSASAANVTANAAAHKEQTKFLFQYLNRPVSESLDIVRRKIET